MNDLINGAFEGGAFLFVLPSILKLLREREVRGVHWSQFSFICIWGLWNLYYYPSLGQWASFWGGVVLVAANLIYLGLMIKFWERRPCGYCIGWPSDMLCPACKKRKK